MKFFFSVFLVIFWNSNIASQTLQIKTECIDELRVQKFLVKKDSMVTQYDDPDLSILRFYVRFNKVTFDKSSGEFCMTGKVCSTTGNCLGIPRINIFKASRDMDGKLQGVHSFAETSFGGDTLSNDGNFCFRIHISAAESVFFSMSSFYLEEFRLGEFVEKFSTKKIQKCFVR